MTRYLLGLWLLTKIFCLIAAVAIVLIYVVGLTAPQQFNDDLQFSLSREVESVVSKISDHKKAHGSCPSKVELPQSSLCGGWKYHVSEDGLECKLTIGAYDKNCAFQFNWRSDTGKWDVYTGS